MDDVERSIDAWTQSLDAVIELGSTLTDGEWLAPTECPEWTVKDVYAHLVGGEIWMAAGHPRPQTGLAHIADAPVAQRRGVSGPDVLSELREVYAGRRRQLRDEPPDPQAPTFTAYLAPVTVGVLLRMRAFDAWVHEQDVRRALARPGDLDSAGAGIAAEIFLLGLARAVVKGAGATPGTVVRFVVDGGVAFDRAVVVDDNRRGQLAEPPSSADVRLAMGWETFSRLAAGRVAAADAVVEIEGDLDLANRVLGNFAVTP